MHGVCYYTYDSKSNIGRTASGRPLALSFRPRCGVSQALLGTVDHALHVLLQDTFGDRAHHGIDHLPMVEEY